MKQKKRLDELVREQHPEFSRQQIQSWIIQGKVVVDDKIVTKPGTQYTDDVRLQINAETPKYVSRAGFKLEKALQAFAIDVTGLVVLDAGISTGGFTDCLLQSGASKVYGIDVGYGQVHEKIGNDSRVQLREKTNLRSLESVGELVDLITLDLSFISVLKVMDAVKRLLKPEGALVVLIKPQFEAGKHEVSSGGIVKDEKIRKLVVDMVVEGINGQGFICKGVIDSPILGAKGNKEFLAYFKREGKESVLSNKEL